ncbi:hypothetical protein GH714_025746 [Hevea brasiliensis]|uniref:CRM domain-containing protein n=1 Tax=Hevea brasiliensis TaxID=3981 RepID=A0A6A6LRB8_HEVBR|nr:hypothetical protein GH714_025746 [Hevea brasiliensis]
MALKFFPIPFPIFAPLLNPNPSQNLSQHHQRPPTEVRFSRWNNANAREFNERQRAQKEIEDDLRRHRRFDSATKIVHNYDSGTASASTETFKSIGTPSSPSNPSIRGKKSKYSKPETSNSHPAFRGKWRISEQPQPKTDEIPIDRNANIKISEDGLSYVINGAPFEFKYSYTETPRVKPVKLREQPFSPFGPTTTARPWTGRAPLPPSKKKLREFDSFKLPPPDKKGVKPVQSPGPFLPGSGPRYVYTREEILGEPLTREEVKALIDGCLKSKRQLNMGRDGLTHNMLDNIHAHWKRRRVCKIKCKGVCTVDMDNVCQQLEERTGGKIIYRKAGVVYLFRGRNYNHKTRPRFPLMLWKPITPVYPRLIQRVPKGLTLEEASEMRKKGRKLIPICKLVKDVQEAFEECELVRINCQGINGSDYRKVGAKLKELVPCVLISFEHEHILMWRGRDWKSSFTKPVNDSKEAKGSDADSASIVPSVEDQKIEMVSVKGVLSVPNTGATPVGCEEQTEDLSAVQLNVPCAAMGTSSTTREMCENNPTSDNAGSFAINESEAMGYAIEMSVAPSVGSDTMLENVGSTEEVQDALEGSPELNEPTKLSVPYATGVLQLWKQAVESGSAVVLVDANLDADTVYQTAVDFARSAPPSPDFRHRPRKVSIQQCEKQEIGDLQVKEVTTVAQTEVREKRSFKLKRRKDSSEQYLDSAPQGSLGVDELAKLLA